MGREVCIDIRDVRKAFRIHSERNGTVKERILYSGRARYSEFVALDGVTLSIAKGSSVGLIGSNGSGKSTLLKLVSRILFPDAGSINVNGRVSSLLELGAGFHPDFTGMENIYMNASLLGLSKREITRKVDEILDFSGLGEFIAQPVRSYSSGMYMRLAFSVATAIEPDILLIDEVLAVGDAEFQTKCFARLAELRKAGSTIVMVTHDLGSVERFCDRAVWLHKGVVRDDGEPRSVGQLYTAFAYSRIQAQPPRLEQQLEGDGGRTPGEEGSSNGLRWGTGVVKLTRVVPIFEDGLQIGVSGRRLAFTIYYECSGDYRDGERLMFGMNVADSMDHSVYGTNTQIDGIEISGMPRQGHIVFEMNSLQLLQGMYTFDASVYSADGTAYDHWLRCAEFMVSNGYPEAGVARLEHRWVIMGEKGGLL